MLDTEKNFNNIKIHTQYSICEGAIKIDDLANSGDFEYVDYGPVQSSDDRKKTSQNIIKITEVTVKILIKIFLKLFSKINMSESKIG